MTTPSFVRFNQSAFALILTTAAILAAACGGGNPSAPSSGGSSGTSGTSGSSGSSGTSSSAVAGTYRLATVNGMNVPCVFDSYSPGPGVTMSMHAIRGVIIVNGDGTYTQEYEMRLTGSNMQADQVVVKNVVGTYTIQGTTLTLTPMGGQPFSPAYSPGNIEIVAEAPALDGGTDVVTFSYRR